MEIIVTPKKERVRINESTGQKIKLKVAAYARVSTDLDDQRNSFEFQKEEFETRIKQNPDWEFVKMYADRGISGTQIKNRNQFKQMMSDSLSGKIDLILTKSISRFARNTVDFLVSIRKLAEKNVSVFFEKENITTNKDNVDLVLTLYASLAESESRSISDNVKWGVRKRMSKNTLKVPVRKIIGYSRKNDGTWYLNEDAPLVKNVFIYFLQGYTYRQIVEMMKKEDTEHKFEWRPNTIHRILTNEKYKGFVIHQKTVTVDVLTHKQVKNNGIEPMYTIKDHHPAIVSESTFDYVQILLKNGIRDTSNHSNYFELAGLVVCEECGRTLRRVKYAHNNEVVLTCKGRTKNDIDYKECSSNVIPLLAINELTKKVINDVKEDTSIADSFVMSLIDELSSEDLMPQIDSLKKQIHDVKAEIDELVKKQVNSDVSEDYDDEFKRLKTKRTSLLKELSRFENLAKQNFKLKKNVKQMQLFLNENKGIDLLAIQDIVFQIIHRKNGSLRYVLKGANFESLTKEEIEYQKNSLKPFINSVFTYGDYCVAYDVVILKGEPNA